MHALPSARPAIDTGGNLSAQTNLIFLLINFLTISALFVLFKKTKKSPQGRKKEREKIAVNSGHYVLPETPKGSTLTTLGPTIAGHIFGHPAFCVTQYFYFYLGGGLFGP